MPLATTRPVLQRSQVAAPVFTIEILGSATRWVVGLPDDCVLHALRKTAARKLAEAGYSEYEIKAITGHVSSRMVAHYTKGANQKKRATAAILKLERNSE